MILYTNKYQVPFQIDEADHLQVSRYTWCINDRGYVTSSTNRKIIRLHHLLLGRPPPVGMVTDHINRDTLDNRRRNLRFVTHVVSLRNRGLRRTNRSSVNGVYWHKRAKLWHVKIRLGGRDYHIGYYDTIEEAKSDTCNG